MPQKKKTVSKGKPARKRTKPAASGSQLMQLRSMVSQLRDRIEKEAHARAFFASLEGHHSSLLPASPEPGGGAGGRAP